MIVSLVTGVQVLLSLSMVTIALCSAPVWELGGAPALTRVRMVTAQLMVVTIAQALAFNFYLSAGKFFFQEILNFYGLHVQPRSAPDALGRPSYKKARRLRTPKPRRLTKPHSVERFSIGITPLRVPGGRRYRRETG